MSIYSDLVRYFELCKAMDNLEQEILSHQYSVRSVSYGFTGARSQPRNDSLVENDALKLIQLKEKHHSIFKEFEQLHKVILEEIETDPDEKTRYTMWCIIVCQGDMKSAQRLSCLSQKKFYSIFNSYMEKVKENVCTG